jgi:hypothetical protein
VTETREVYEQRRQAVADKILADPEHFNMVAFVRGFSSMPDPMCGTTLCIAGWAVLQIPGVTLARRRGDEVDLLDEEGCRISTSAIADMVADWLGLDAAQADRLFYGGFDPEVERDPNDEAIALITPAEAVAALMAAPYACEVLGVLEP